MTPHAVRCGDRFRRWVRAPIDAVIWAFAIFGATWLRYDFDRRSVLVGSTALLAITVACATILTCAKIGPYRVGHQRGSSEEAIDVGGEATPGQALFERHGSDLGQE